MKTIYLVIIIPKVEKDKLTLKLQSEMDSINITLNELKVKKITFLVYRLIVKIYIKINR